MSSAFEDDEDYPLVDWAADRDVLPALTCTLCWGEGLSEGLPCPCLVAALTAAFPAAAEDAEPDPACRRCGGDGEDRHGQVCPCWAEDLRRCAEAEPGP